MTFFIICLVSMGFCMVDSHAHCHITRVEIRGQLGEVVWVPGMKPGSSRWSASIFTCCVISIALERWHS